jgi:signal transduction histidine kinase
MDTRAYRLAIAWAGLYLLLGVCAYWLGNQPSLERSGQILGDPGGGMLVALWVATALFVGLAWALRGAARLPVRIALVAPWVLPAVVGPIALYPVAAIPGDAAVVAVAVLWPTAVLPLGLGIAGLAPEGRERLMVATGATAVLAMAVGLVPLVLDVGPTPLLFARFLFAASVVGLAGVAVFGGSRDPAALSTHGGDTSRVLTRAAVFAGCMAPAVAGSFMLMPWDLALVIAIVALVGGLVAARVAVRPLASVAIRANTQRDLAVAVSEAERSRLAADLHDGPLQDVLLLARRLDAIGDSDGADLAREIGADLRDLSGDLRLPMLDDLGVGPALEWLVSRARRLTGLDVTLRYEADGRPPPDVELAAFRIAQEAIANAVRHGQPPVVVRCRTSGVTLSMSIEDAGSARTGPVLSTRPIGQFGLLNMQQRAEQVGARLEFSQKQVGGTTVAVEWQAANAT